MDVVFVLLPLSLLIAAIGVAAFVWAVRSGQFEDLETPAVRILFDDEPAPSGAGRSEGGAAPRETDGLAHEDEHEHDDGLRPSLRPGGVVGIDTERDGAR